MDFLDFCRSHGIIINDYPPIGVWKRYPTEDHPRKRNGAVKYLQTHGFVQNHAMSTVVSLWKPDPRQQTIDQLPMSEILRRQRDAEKDRAAKQKDAMRKAVQMLNASGFSTHKYLADKGFPDEQGNVLHIEGKPVLLIPMRAQGNLVGLQQITEDGQKKFLYGQKTNFATFKFDNKGINVLCEGYATALSVRSAMKQLKRRYTIHVCFSAGNMVKVASTLEPGIVIADNDKSGTGQAAAAEIGWPTWLSDRESEDANDYCQRVGLFQFSQSLTQLMLDIGTGRHYQ